MLDSRGEEVRLIQDGAIIPSNHHDGWDKIRQAASTGALTRDRLADVADCDETENEVSRDRDC